ncbi:HEAT repeat domain-containing protein [Taklimakanibacter lacteus]|uniref:HEAT repeat domain-containing protein n=1 Tax=Taklimakanibacter lacteus TaxID=2268456 RepID=UPI000E66C527
MRMRLVAILLCALFCEFSEAAAQPAEPPILTCQSLEQCVALLQKPYPCMPDCPGGDRLDYGFIDGQGGYFSLPVQFDKFGRPGVLALLDLLKCENLSIRARAGMVLSRLSTLTPEDLRAILQESHNGNEWLDPAFARIEPTEALSELVSLLKASPDLQKQHGWSLRSLGNEVTPFRLETLACETSRGCILQFDRIIAEIVGGPVLQQDSFLVHLMDPAIDRTQSQPKLACSTLEHCLTLLQVPYPCSIDCVREELPSYDFINRQNGYFSLWAQFEKFGRPGVLALLVLLDDPDLSIRARAGMVLSDLSAVTAADMPAILKEIYAGNFWIEPALMRIGTPEALSELRGAIERQTGYARISHIGQLGKIGLVAKSMGPYLVAKLHDDDWGTREEAARVLGVIQYQPAVPSLVKSVTPSDWKLTLAAIASLNQLGSVSEQVEDAAQSYWQPGIRATAQRLLDGESASTFSSRAPFWTPIISDCGGRVGETNTLKPGAKLASRPEMAGAVKAGMKIAVEGGTLVAIDEGEFGGALEFRSDDRSVQRLIKEEAVSVVLASEKGIFALTGSGHMGLDDGFIYKVEKNADGKWSAHIVWRLPGAPRAAVVSSTGTLGIQTDYGDVIFRPESGMEWISCVDWMLDNTP